MINLECSNGHEVAHCSVCGAWYCPTCQFSLHMATCEIKTNARLVEQTRREFEAIPSLAERFVEDKKRRLW